MMRYEYLLVIIPKILRFSFGNLEKIHYLCSELINLSIYYATIKHYGANGTRPTLLSLHPTAFSMAETQASAQWWSSLGTPRHAEATDISSGGSQHYLPTLRTPVRASLFRVFMGIRGIGGLLRGKSDFQTLKTPLSSEETPGLLGVNRHSRHVSLLRNCKM